MTSYRRELPKLERFNLPRTMILQLDTTQLNPNITKDNLEEERLRDEDSHNMEYGIGEAEDGDRFFNSSLLTRIKFDMENIFTVPEIKTSGRFVPDFFENKFKYDPEAVAYGLFLDPSTKRDPFGLCVGHWTVNDEIKIDGMSVIRSDNKHEINASEVRSLLMRIVKTIPIQYCIFDIYLYNEIRQDIAEYGIEVIKNILTLSDWNQFKDQCGAESISMPNEEYFKKEFRELLIKNGTKVDHSYGGSNDMIYAVCQNATFPFRDRKDMLEEPQMLAGVSCVNR